ncbi:MAG: hypothetical protein ABSH20_18500 [Tepidisphaeraceae bacterium]|jgi:hypothetical protein
MSDPIRRRHPLHPLSILRFIGKSFTRIYALALMLVLCYAGYLAVTYLIAIIMRPVQTPRQMLEWQARTDVASLREADSPGVSSQAARAPMAHYHRIETWFQTDPGNGCTASGCHEPLPHGKKMKVPAFANFHMAFLECQACHGDPPTKPVKMAWLNIQNGQQQDVPAILQLIKLLDEKAQAIEKTPADVQAPIAALLKAMLAARGPERMLEDLLIQVETLEPGSPVWRMTVQRLAAELPSYARGEYGAKLIPQAAIAGYADNNQQMKRLARQYLAGDGAERKALEDKAHAGVVKHPTGCVMCHSDSPGLIDYAAVGYLPSRARDLRDLPLAKRMQGVLEGKPPFYLPKPMGGSDEK